MPAIADPSALAALWQRARAMFARAGAAIGEPQAVAARTELTRETKRDIAGWLARLESIVRKLLLALAAGLVEGARHNVAHGAPRLSAATAAAAATQSESAFERLRQGALDRTQSETWPAQFALSPPRDPHAVPESRAPRIRALWGPAPPVTAVPSPLPPQRITEPALRFALRLEALRRVLADPIPHARRLARLFRRLNRRYPEATSRFAVAPTRPYAVDPVDPRLILDAIGVAIGVAQLLAHTS